MFIKLFINIFSKFNKIHTNKLFCSHIRELIDFYFICLSRITIVLINFLNISGKYGKSERFLFRSISFGEVLFVLFKQLLVVVLICWQIEYSKGSYKGKDE